MPARACGKWGQLTESSSYYGAGSEEGIGGGFLHQAGMLHRGGIALQELQARLDLCMLGVERLGIAALEGGGQFIAGDAALVGAIEQFDDVSPRSFSS
ncbi:hypothetical protein [Noviherbaspirillum humi]|uniref:hypothetical protein n=1 Tax=Noviherbaspirillum humi TaxID=1688639 RepID=UPI000B781CC6|nr:hypothetical protein [Noviherbaspirillum humi]